jgi:ATP-binding cassette, subfamily B, multidrug efflux pump
MNHRLRWIWDVWRPHKLWILLLLFLTALSTAVAVASPLVLKQLIDLLSDILKAPDLHPTPSKEVNRIIMLLLGIGFVRLLSSVYPGFRAFLNLTFEYLLRRKYFGSILEKDWRFFREFRTGDLVTRLTVDIADFPKIGWFLCSGIFRAFDSLMKIVFCLATMFYLDARLTWLSLLPLPVMIAVFYIVSGRLQHSFKTNQEAISEINNQLELSFSGIRIIKSFVCEAQYNRFFRSALDNRFTTEMRLLKLNTFIHLIYEYIESIAQVGIIGFGGYMAVKGELSIGSFLAFYTYLSMLIYPVLDLPQLFVSGKQAFVNIDRLDEIRDFPAEHHPGERKVTGFERIRFNRVDFAYHGREILHDLDFTVTRGRKIAVVGPVGSGKSTLLGLLTGHLTPSRGEVEIDGTPLTGLDLATYRDLLGYVPQEPLLFSGSLRENVEFGAQADTDRIQEALSAAQIAGEIESFPEGERTVIGQRGVTLSGGQKQRMAIARAIVRSPKLLLLDDITASLDAENEEKLWTDLNRMFGELTCLIVSHRTSTLRYVDEVLFLDGKDAFGPAPHEELLKNPRYRAFMEHEEC